MSNFEVGFKLYHRLRRYSNFKPTVVQLLCFGCFSASQLRIPYAQWPRKT